MNRQDGVSRFSLNLMVSGGMAALLAATFGLYVWSETREDRATDLRLHSLQLIDEARQFGDDATQLVRSYVATGDPVHRRRAQEILDIRDGRKPRPNDRMRQAGFTEVELRKLAEARANADAQTARELEAMALVESAGAGDDAVRSRALSMLFSSAYEDARAAARRPLDECRALVDRRTLAAARTAEARDTTLAVAFVVVGLGLLFSLWRTYGASRQTLGGGLDQVHAQIARIARGETSSVIAIGPGKEDSVLGWLAAMQVRLNDRAGERAQAEAALRESERRYRDMLSDVELVAVMLDLDGRVTFSNDHLLRLTGWRREEVLGSDWFERFVPPSGKDVRNTFGALRDGRPSAAHHENEILTRSGERRVIRWNNSVLRSPAGAVIGTASIGEDVTERQRREAMMAEQLAELRRWHDAMISRESRVLELKHEVNDLLAEAGETIRYPSAAAPGGTR